MATVGPPLPRGAVTPLRLLAVLCFLVSITGGLVYLFGGSMRMVYWGGALWRAGAALARLQIVYTAGQLAPVQSPAHRAARSPPLPLRARPTDLGISLTWCKCTAD